MTGQKPIPVMEIFGPTIQGEGMVIGRKTMFVRTGGCDYRCRWCDSAFTWDGTGKSKPMVAEDIISKLDTLAAGRFDHVTLSGGNPALHAGIGDLIHKLHAKNIQAAVETQGTIWQDWLTHVDDVTISPKPPSSGMETDWKKLDTFMTKLSPQKTSLKVVIFNEEDYAFAKLVHMRYPHISFFLQVGNDDIHTTDDTTLLTQLRYHYEQLIEKVMLDSTLTNVRVLPQLHTWMWGNKRGV
ncbi:7-carboxy-7-deazaguanine synthase QueE [Shouchella lonarensis]|uniref:7-carboxy-7-deazaguanine synthase n=1 Tax=Shouchella lonarensis TaxID=1464122 RepID=A0A1G6H6Z4_9BACI|nr:7-carboxy-7-deazaguanine synthase QueE [Shouchella lonarensis]SDB89933.1 preQ(0) biosynthesis protein QueE [Shouchella lonarensis]